MCRWHICSVGRSGYAARRALRFCVDPSTAFGGPPPFSKGRLESVVGAAACPARRHKITTNSNVRRNRSQSTKSPYIFCIWEHFPARAGQAPPLRRERRFCVYTHISVMAGLRAVEDARPYGVVGHFTAKPTSPLREVSGRRGRRPLRWRLTYLRLRYFCVN